MKWETAVNQLQGLLDNFQNNISWATDMAQLVRDIYGDDSLQHRQTHKYYLMFSENPINALPRTPDTLYADKYIKDMLASMITTIERNRYIRTRKQGNFVSNMGNELMIFILSTAFTAFSGTSFLIGKSVSDYQNVELKQENKKLVNDNVSLRLTIRNLSEGKASSTVKK